MGQLVDSTDESYTDWRRHTDPPNLWLNVLTGSILLHALAILSVRSLVPLLPPLPTQAVPVDLIDVNPATVTSSKSIRNPKTANKLANKQGATGRSLHSPQNISPARSQTARNSVSSLSPIASSTRSPQQSRVPNGDVPNGFRRSRPVSPFTRPFTTPSPNSTHSGTPTPQPSPSPTTSQSSRPNSPSTPAASDSQGGQGLAMNIVDSRLGNGGRDIPDSAAKPKIRKMKFPNISYTAQTRKHFGKAVELRVTISAKGECDGAQVKSGSGDPDYDELVKDELLTWEFEPAYEAGKPVLSLLDISVTLDPIKQR